ncbi:MAG TPA: Uma2 family endonuclease [Polyangia bacterium]
MNVASIPPEARRLLRVSEYHRMIAAGVIDEDERLELLGGVLVRMSPRGLAHARAIQRLTHLLVRALGDEYVVRCQLPLTLSDETEPEPDVAVVTLAEAEAGETHPRTAALVIEVASDSVEKDRDVKSPMYAAAGIPEYWIVNLAERCVEVYRDPSPSGRYRSALTVAPGQELHPACAPDLIITVSEVLGA